MAGQRTEALPASRGLSPKSRLVAAAAQRQGAGQRVAQENRQPPRQAPPPERGSSTVGDEAQGCIPAFRPPSPPQGAHQLLTPGSDCGSPGRAQLEAVRALRPSASMQQHRQRTPEGTPGLSEASSVGRAINAQIASSIADLFAATPQPESSGRHGSTGTAAAPEAHVSEPRWTAEPAWAPQLDAPQAAARVPTKPQSPQMPVPPPVPLKLATAMRSDSGRLEPRSSPQVGCTCTNNLPALFEGVHAMLQGAGHCVAESLSSVFHPGMTTRLPPTFSAIAGLPQPRVHEPQAAVNVL